MQPIIYDMFTRKSKSARGL